MAVLVGRAAKQVLQRSGWVDKLLKGTQKALEPYLSLCRTVEGEFKGVGKKGQACVQLARILQYLECPQ